MREINDYITIFAAQRQLHAGPCSVSDVKPGDTDITATGLDALPQLRITITYSPALEDVLLEPEKRRFTLARRPEANADIISIARSQDRREVIILV